MMDATTLIVGASFSGLATAAALQRRGVDHLLVERTGQVGTPWREHYERLHLHTSKAFSSLPFKKFGRYVPRYPSREQVVEYLEAYQRHFSIEPRFDTEVWYAARAGEEWVTQTNKGGIRSKYLVMATGAYGRPRVVRLPGMGSFPGPLLHSSAYKTGAAFKGQRVLVIGFGNSACEIAIDLVEQGASPSMSVRSPVNVVPRDVFGIPVLALSILLRPLPPRTADAISAPLMRALVGNIERLGLRRMPYGPLEEIRRDGNAPVLDIGTIGHIRKGHIQIYDDIDRIEGGTVFFKGGRSAPFDAIVAAIGYTRGFGVEVQEAGPQGGADGEGERLRADGGPHGEGPNEGSRADGQRLGGIVDAHSSRFDDLRRPVRRQEYFGKDNLYFCGYWVSPTGQIREIGRDARRIAGDIGSREAKAH